MNLANTTAPRARKRSRQEGAGVDSSLLLDRYILQDDLGSGSGGVVNLAWDTRIQRNVAIKRIPLPAHASDDAIPGLEEARTGAQLHDSRIVNVYDFEVTDDDALLIMEFVDGISLGTLMDRIPRMLTLDEVASVVQNVGKALQHAHTSHVLHLDVKPDNILIDTSGLSKVTDFGIGRLARAAGFGQATAGTIGYMPPEQIRGEEVTERTDQWAFAALVYELLVGEDPFIAPTFEESLELIERAEIILPSSVDEEIDEEVDDILFRALSLDPAQRYPSVAKFVSAIMPHLGDAKSGRTRLGKLIGLFGDEVTLGSPEERLARLRAMEERPIVAAPPLSEDEDSFYDADETEFYRPPDDDPYDVEDEPDPYDERMMVRKHHRPRLKDAIGDQFATVLTYVIGGVINGVIAYIGAMALPLPEVWMAWIVVGVAAAVGAIWPRVGSLVSLVVLCTGLVFANWIPQAAILGVLALVWWGFMGRTGDAESNCALLGPSCGVLGLGFLQPLMSGYFFTWQKTLFTALAGLVFMLIILPLTGSDELFKSSLTIVAHTPATDINSYNIYSTHGLWVEALGWLLAALAMSVLANRGSKGLSLLGAVLATVIIIVSRVVHGYVEGYFQDLVSVEYVVAVAVPLLITCLAVWLYTPGTERNMRAGGPGGPGGARADNVRG